MDDFQWLKHYGIESVFHLAVCIGFLVLFAQGHPVRGFVFLVIGLMLTLVPTVLDLVVGRNGPT